MGKLWEVVDGLRPILMMIVIQLMSAGMVIMYKLASEYDMSMKVLTAYRYTIASATLIPLAFIFERKSRPKLTWMVVLQAFSSAFFAGTMAQNMYAESLVLTSATFATAMFNLVPAVTFIMALLFRIEKLGLRSMGGKAKVLGTLISISGAMVLTLYKGVEVKLWSTSLNLLHKKEQQSSGHSDQHNPFLGIILIITSVITSSFSLIIQSKMTVRYPCHYSSSALICTFGALQTVVYALCAERNWSRWKLGWDVRLLTSIYAGVVASGLSNSISMWCVRMRGPLFVSIFNPLMLIMVAIASSLCLNEKLFLGSVLGATFIICGLYIVIWGKSKEMKGANKLSPSRTIEAAEQAQHNVTIDVSRADETNNNVPIVPLGVGPNMVPPIFLSSEGGENKEISNEIVGRGIGNHDCAFNFQAYQHDEGR